MKKLMKFAAFLVLFSLVLNTGCKKDEPVETTTSYTTLKDYMVANDLDLPALLGSWVIDAKPTSVEGGIVDEANGYTIPSYHVFDVRDEAAFNAGHINGAIRVNLADVVTKAADYTDKPILVACASGQTAGHAVMALMLSGYADAKVLKWGMSGWNNDLAGSWNSNAGSENGNKADGNSNWVTSTAPAKETGNTPTWTSTSTDGAQILAERVNAMLASDFQNETGTNVLDNPAAYQIFNFWPNDIYESIGHFDGAYQLETISLAGDATGAINPGETSLVYCYTGQTSSMAVAWLNVLGFNAKSILFGANGLKYDALVDLNNPKVVWNGSHGYDYVSVEK